MSGRVIEVFPSAARTATPTAVRINTRESGLLLVINTSASATPSTVPAIAGYDPISGQHYSLLSGAAIVANGTVHLQVYPGATFAANLVLNALVPDYVRISMTHGNGNSHTYSVSAHLLD